MLRFINTNIVFQEIPEEVTLAINISNCPCHCPGCHSRYLWKDVGRPLTPSTINTLIERFGDSITCICLMGGDAEPASVNKIARYIHETHKGYKVAWYSGRQLLPQAIKKSNFDYIKLGPYIKHLGGLKEKTTNQRLYKHTTGENFIDITNKFWK